MHQQDIQAYVNALWAGGAEAITLQGQRLISTTGIKCVGNTVVLDGVPYSPPYVIEAIGDVGAHERIDGDVADHRDVRQLRRPTPSTSSASKIEDVDNVKAPAYTAPVSLQLRQGHELAGYV